MALAAGVAASLPILIAMVYAVVDGWVPLGDDAYIGIRAYDVFTDRFPLVGQRSSGASGVLDETAYSPGPLLFWLMAVPARMPDGVFMALTAGVVNVASVMGTVALAFRRGGRPLMFATAIAIPVMLASLPAETYSDVWNSSAPLMPLMLLVFLAWSVACGEYRLLPLTVVVASFATQAHLTFLMPAMGVTAVALGCAVAFKSVRSWPRRWVLATLAVGLVCWSAPLLDQAVNRPGNFVNLAKSATSDEPSLGYHSAWKAVAHTAGIPPWWLQDDRDTLKRIGDLSTRPSPFAILTALLVVGALAAVALVGWRRRRADVFAAGTLGLTLCVAVGMGAASTPINSFGTVGYTMRWASPAGMCVWLLLGWSVASLLPAGSLAGLRRRALSPAAGLAAVAAIGALIAIAENPPRQEPYQGMRTIAEGLEANLPPEGGTWVEVASSGDTLGLGSELQVGTIYWLRRHGRAVVAPPNVVERLSGDYARGGYRRKLQVAVDVPPEPGGRRIARVAVTDPIDQKSTRVVTLTVLPED